MTAPFLNGEEVAESFEREERETSEPEIGDKECRRVLRNGIGNCDGIFRDESEEGEDEEQAQDEAGGAGAPSRVFT